MFLAQKQLSLLQTWLLIEVVQEGLDPSVCLCCRRVKQSLHWVAPFLHRLRGSLVISPFVQLLISSGFGFDSRIWLDMAT